MLIIFDLDDTLIDTTGFVTPFKLQESVRFLIDQAGFKLDFEEALRDLQEINSRSIKSKDALMEFVLKHQGSQDDYKNVLNVMLSPLPENFTIPTTPGALEIVMELSKEYKIACVTGGNPSFQIQKMEKAGIDRAIFSNIAIPEDSIKKPHYERLIMEHNLSPKDVIVIGDRVEMDLMPAFELGCTTVHMRWGRGKLTQDVRFIHHSIDELSQIKRILNI